MDGQGYTVLAVNVAKKGIFCYTLPTRWRALVIKVSVIQVVNLLKEDWFIVLHLYNYGLKLKIQRFKCVHKCVVIDESSHYFLKCL